MMPVSERRVCRVLGQHRSTQRKVPCGADDEQALTEDIIALAKQYGRYGYRRVTALLRDAGWTVNRKRVERIWRKEGLKVPQKQPKRGRLWLNDGSCIRLRPEYPGHVWAYDFVEGRTHDGRKFRILTIIDEASRECLALVVARKLKHQDVLAALAELFVSRGPPAHIRSDNGSEFIATAVQEWLGPDRGEDALHRARISLGEWLQRELQRLATGRAAQRRDLLQPCRGQGADRGLAPPLQHRASAQQPWLSSACPGNGDAAIAAFRFRLAPPPAGKGAGGDNALTINPDHSVGAGQNCAIPF
jgi:putative transposase